MALDSLVSAGFSTILSTISGVKNEKKQLQLQEYLAKLSLDQKASLEKRMQDNQNAIERQKILFEAMALEKNHKLIAESNKDRNFSLLIVGVGAIALAGVILIAKKSS